MENSDALALSRAALRFLIVVNWLFGLGVLAMLITTFVATEWMARALGVFATPDVLLGMRAIMVIGVIGTPVAYIAFSRLLSIVDSVGRGDPFIRSNAKKLQAIAWALLVLEVCRLFVVFVVKALSAVDQRIQVDVDVALTPWLAVLLLFVLARVFEQGAMMREELEATI